MGLSPAQVRSVAQLEHVIFEDLEVLTLPELALQQFIATQDQTTASRQMVLCMAASLARSSKAPWCKALVRAAEVEQLSLREPEVDLVGQSLLGTIDRTRLILGTKEGMFEQGVELGVTSTTLADQFEASGAAVYFLAQRQPKRLLGVFALKRQFSPVVRDVFTYYEAVHVHTHLLTTEKTKVANALANEIGAVTLRSELSAAEIRGLVQKITQSSKGTLVVSSITQGVQLSFLGTAPYKVKLSRVDDVHTLHQHLSSILTKTKKRFFWFKP